MPAVTLAPVCNALVERVKLRLFKKSSLWYGIFTTFAIEQRSLSFVTTYSSFERSVSLKARVRSDETQAPLHSRVSKISEQSADGAAGAPSAKAQAGAPSAKAQLFLLNSKKNCAFALGAAAAPSALCSEILLTRECNGAWASSPRIRALKDWGQINNIKNIVVCAKCVCVCVLAPPGLP